MHYYKRNLGDYAKKCGRLSMLEHGAYTLLIDACYDREQFPTLDEAIEWAWARSSEEIEAVKFVLGRFFSLENGVYVQKRIKEEIDEYHGKASTNKRIAEEREQKRRDALTTREQQSTNRARTVHEPSPEQHEPPPNQEPRTKNQEPLLKTYAADAATAGKPPLSVSSTSSGSKAQNLGDRQSLNPERKKPDRKPDFDAKAELLTRGVSEQVANDFIALRKAKRAPLSLTAIEGIEREAKNVGTSLETAIKTCLERGWQGFNAGWITGDQSKGAINAKCRTASQQRESALAQAYSGSGGQGARIGSERIIDVEARAVT